MNTRRRATGALGAGIGTIASVAMFAGVASAAPTAYTTTPTCTVSSSAGAGGTTITFTCTIFIPFELVSLDFFSKPIHLETVRADKNGALTDQVRIPTGLPCGAHKIVATGLKSGRTASAKITITSTCRAGSGNNGNGDGNGSSNLPRTGAIALGGIGAAGIALFGGGVALAARRRRNVND